MIAPWKGETLTDMTRLRVAVLGVLVAGVISLPMAAPAAEESPLALPDLRMIAPEEVMGPRTGPLFGFTDPPFVIEGCYPDEIARRQARRCLRFDTIVGNFGEGTFEVAYEVDLSKSLATAYQHLFREDGTYIERYATRSEFHPTHVHFHIRNFYLARLWRSTPTGGRLGEALSGGSKNGFCPADVDEIEGSEQNEPRQYTCFTDWEMSGLTPSQVVGISAGWLDVYGYALPDQYVEISRLGDGYYALEIDLDPNNVFTESDETNNAVCVVLLLQGSTARLLNPMPPC